MSTRKKTCTTSRKPATGKGEAPEAPEALKVVTVLLANENQLPSDQTPEFQLGFA